METPAQFPRGCADSCHGLAQHFRQFRRVVRPDVRQCGSGLVPHALVGIQFGGVGRKRFEADPSAAAAEEVNIFTLVNFSVVPDHDEAALNLFQQMPQERGYVHGMNVGFGIAPEVQARPVTCGAHRQRGDDRDLLAPLLASMYRRLAADGPRTSDRRAHQEAAFVDEDEVGTQVFSVFFIRGHSSFFHRSIKSSFRSIARRSGFWQLNPMRCSRRPTWSGWYRTPKVHRMTSATRAVVHNSDVNPDAMGPLIRIRASFCSCRGESRFGLPGEARTMKTPLPSRALWSRQRITELGAHPVCRATSLRFSPSSSNASARWRRAARTFTEPCGRILVPLKAPVYCIIYAVVNNVKKRKILIFQCSQIVSHPSIFFLFRLTKSRAIVRKCELLSKEA